MMNIKDYLFKTHHILNNPIYGSEGDKNEQINTIISLACDRYNLHRIDIYSSSVYPHILYDENKQNYLIWDNHFWNLFDHYSNLVETTTFNKNDAHLLRQAAISLLFLINANLLDVRPSLSKAFADLYATFSPIYGFYDDQFQKPKRSDSIYDLAVHARLYVIFHEISHRKYGKDPMAETNSRIILQRYLDEFHNPDYLYQMLVYPTIKDVAEMLEKVLKDNDGLAIQEFMCDLQACDMLLSSMLQAYEGEIEKEAEYVLAVAVMINRFTCYTNRNLKKWKYIYDLWHQSSGTIEFIHAHNHNQLLYTDEDIKLRIKMLQIAFSRHCEMKYDIPVIIKLWDDYFATACEHIFDWGFVQEIIIREKLYYNKYSPEQNLKDIHSMLKWN